MSFDDLSSENIMLYATKAYDKPNCIMSELKLYIITPGIRSYEEL